MKANTSLRISVLTLLIIFSFFQAHADILIEPFVGIERPTTGGGGANPSFGARIGYEILGFSIGGQYSAFNGKGEFPNGSGVVESLDFTGANIGAFLSFQLPISFRFFATYNFNTEATLKNVGIDPDGGGALPETRGDLVFKGNGTEIGVSYTGLPLVNINLSKSIVKNTDVSHPVESAANATITAQDSETYWLTLSFPFQI